MHKGGIHRKERFGLNSFTFVKLVLSKSAEKRSAKLDSLYTIGISFINASHEVKKKFVEEGCIFVHFLISLTVQKLMFSKHS